ncbi:fasciclin domain-containing protein [Ilumatobacter sp.]|uniref:fasciclin domain-containing protein n=1 Tax=Ilumatobacter sp. TaxID=1967498 RepID=UPI003C5E3B79
MSVTSPISFRRYRRRILTLGVVAFLIVFAIGAVIAIPVVQNELEDRVENELDEQDIDGVTASFSGQDGTLVCAQPLEDPDAALSATMSLRGVNGIDLDTTCTADDTGTEADPSDSAPASSSTVATGDSGVDAATTAPSTDEPALPSIVGVLAEDPLFDQLSELIGSAGLDDAEGLGPDGPITLFAPTDAAFDEAFEMLGADTFGALTSDEDVLRELLLQHMTEGALTSDLFVDGPLEMLGGSTVEVDVDALTLSTANSTAGIADPDTQLDITASNGVIHAIDRILVPDDFEIPTPPDPALTTVEYLDGRVDLRGAVADAEQRDELTAAVEAEVDPTNVVDTLTVVDTDGPKSADLDRLAAVTATLVTDLVSGDATLENGVVTLTGVAYDDNGRTAVQQEASASDVTVDLSVRPTADPASAEALQDELNRFVAENPIRFEPSSAELTPESLPIVDQVAARIARLAGVDVVVVGYTDTSGTPASNELISNGRAGVVRDALVTRGLPADDVSAEGRGESDPILDPDGAEDADASRRVEFLVTSR